MLNNGELPACSQLPSLNFRENANNVESQDFNVQSTLKS